MPGNCVAVWKTSRTQTHRVEMKATCDQSTPEWGFPHMQTCGAVSSPFTTAGGLAPAGPYVMHANAATPSGCASAPSTPPTTRKTAPKVLIVGAGISGLTVAAELAMAFTRAGYQDDEKGCIHVVERENYAGGKVVGWYRGAQGQAQNDPGLPTEHSTRIYGAGYVALFGTMMKIPSRSPEAGFRRNLPQLDRPDSWAKKGSASRRRARTVFDDLVPMFMNYRNARDQSDHLGSSPNQSTYDAAKNMLDLMTSAGIPNSDIRQVVHRFQKYYKASDPDGRLELTAGLTIGQYLGYPTLQPVTQQILNSYIGIIVAARVECDAYSIMNLFENLGFFGSAKTTATIRDSGVGGGNMFPGPSSTWFIDPWVQWLQGGPGADGGGGGNFKVRFHFGCGAINSLDDITNFTTAQGQGGWEVKALCVPHMVSAKWLGPRVFPGGSLHNEWSWGQQYYVDTAAQLQNLVECGLISLNRESNYYNFVLGSPWQVIYCVEFAGSGTDELNRLRRNEGLPSQEAFWPPDPTQPYSPGSYSSRSGPDFGGALATITVTASNQYTVGLLYGKAALYCTPGEMLDEMLFQIGVVNADIRASLLTGESKPAFGSIQYVSSERAIALQKERPEYLIGPEQVVGSQRFRWVSDYTLYIKTPYVPSIGTRGVCSIKNSRDNPACTDINQLPRRVANVTGSANWHFFGIANKTVGVDASGRAASESYTVPGTFDPVPDGFYLAGEYTETPMLQIPTMEKACESGKVAAQTILSDLGVVDPARLARLTGLSKQGPPIQIDQDAITQRFVPASAVCQVDGIQPISQLVDFTKKPDAWTTVRLWWLMATKIQYPESGFALFVVLQVVAALVVVGVVVATVLLLKKKKRGAARKAPLGKQGTGKPPAAAQPALSPS